MQGFSFEGKHFFKACELFLHILYSCGRLAVWSSEAQIIKLYFKGYLWDFYLQLSTALSFSLQAKGEIGLSYIMMARALLLHWLSSPDWFGGHPSSVVLTGSASSCVRKQGGRYYCLAHERERNIPFGGTGMV